MFFLETSCHQIGNSYIVLQGGEVTDSSRIQENTKNLDKSGRNGLNLPQKNVSENKTPQWMNTLEKCMKANLWQEEEKCKPKATVSFIYFLFLFFCHPQYW